MKQLIWLFLISGMSTSLAGAKVPPISSISAQAHTVLYHNATILNPATEQELNDGWVLVRDGRIIQIGQLRKGQRTLPGAKQTIALHDQYVMPGLIDVHLHLTAGPHRVEIHDDKPVISMKGHSTITQYHALSTLATGITSALSPAGDTEANAEYARQQRAGQWVGPQLIYAGNIFEPTPILGGSVYPQDELGWQTEMASQQALGATHIKLYTGLNKNELARGVRLAKAAGLRTITHLDNISWQYAVDLGVDALTHALPTSAELLSGAGKIAYQAERKNPLDQRFIYRWFHHVDYDSQAMQQLFSSLAQKQTRVDLTMVVNELLYYARELDTLYPEEAMWVLHPQMRSRWRATMAAPSYDWQAEDFAQAQQQIPKVQQLFKRLYDAGVPLAIGTDSVASGPFYLRELQLSKAAGLNHWQVLQLATINGARHLGLPGSGQLAAGFVADFIVLAENPLSKLSALNTVHTVVQRGKAVRVDDLKAQLSKLSDAQL